MTNKTHKHIEIVEPNVNYLYEIYKFMKMVLQHPFQPMRKYNIKRCDGVLIEI
jgi:hypothetical protein